MFINSAVVNIDYVYMKDRRNVRYKSHHLVNFLFKIDIKKKLYFDSVEYFNKSKNEDSYRK